MSAMDEIKATVLFKILDDTVGVFRFSNMTEDKWKYWAINRQRFITIFKDEPPNVYWFYGGDFENCLLFFGPEGYRVTADSTDPQDKKIIGKCNSLLKQAKLHEEIDYEIFESFMDNPVRTMTAG